MEREQNAAEALKQTLNEAVAEALAVRAVGGDAGAFSHASPLTAETMVKLMLTLEGRALERALRDAGLSVTSSAFTRRRRLLPEAVFETLFRAFNARCRDARRAWGYRVLLMDRLNLGLSRAGSPSGPFRVSVLYDALSNTFADAALPAEDDAEALTALVERRNRAGERALLVTEDSFSAYQLFPALAERAECAVLLRFPAEGYDRRPPGGVPVRITETEGTGFAPQIRSLRCHLADGAVETLVTDLQPDIPGRDIWELYHAHGGVAAAARAWKHTLQTKKFHGRSVEFAHQELWAALTMSNFCSRIAGAVVPPPERGLYAYQVDASQLSWLCRAFYRAREADGEALLRALAERAEAIPAEAKYPAHFRRCFPGLCYRVHAEPPAGLTATGTRSADTPP